MIVCKYGCKHMKVVAPFYHNQYQDYTQISRTVSHLIYSPPPPLAGVDKFSCMEVALQSRTTSSLLVSWEHVNDTFTTQQDLVVQPFPCHPGKFCVSWQIIAVVKSG